MFYPRAVEGGSKEKPEMLVYDHNTQGIPLTVDSPIMIARLGSGSNIRGGNVAQCRLGRKHSYSK
jgi:hypothetical protein